MGCGSSSPAAALGEDAQTSTKKGECRTIPNPTHHGRQRRGVGFGGAPFKLSRCRPPPATASRGGSLRRGDGATITTSSSPLSPTTTSSAASSGPRGKYAIGSANNENISGGDDGANGAPRTTLMKRSYTRLRASGIGTEAAAVGDCGCSGSINNDVEKELELVAAGSPLRVVKLLRSKSGGAAGNRHPEEEEEEQEEQEHTREEQEEEDVLTFGSDSFSGAHAAPLPQSVATSKGAHEVANGSGGGGGGGGDVTDSVNGTSASAPQETKKSRQAAGAVGGNLGSLQRPLSPIAGSDAPRLLPQLSGSCSGSAIGGGGDGQDDSERRANRRHHLHHHHHSCGSAGGAKVVVVEVPRLAAGFAAPIASDGRLSGPVEMVCRGNDDDDDDDDCDDCDEGAGATLPLVLERADDASMAALCCRTTATRDASMSLSTHLNGSHTCWPAGAPHSPGTSPSGSPMRPARFGAGEGGGASAAAGSPFAVPQAAAARCSLRGALLTTANIAALSAAAAATTVAPPVDGTQHDALQLYWRGLCGAAAWLAENRLAFDASLSPI